MDCDAKHTYLNNKTYDHREKECPTSRKPCTNKRRHDSGSPVDKSRNGTNASPPQTVPMALLPDPSPSSSLSSHEWSPSPDSDKSGEVRDNDKNCPTKLDRGCSNDEVAVILCSLSQQNQRYAKANAPDSNEPRARKGLKPGRSRKNSDPNLDPEVRRMMRMEGNRQAAKRCRERRKSYIMQLEIRSKLLERLNAGLAREIKLLQHVEKRNHRDTWKKRAESTTEKKAREVSGRGGEFS